MLSKHVREFIQETPINEEIHEFLVGPMGEKGESYDTVRKAVWNYIIDLLDNEQDSCEDASCYYAAWCVYEFKCELIDNKDAVLEHYLMDYHPVKSKSPKARKPARKGVRR